jgi:hypothetical protein
VAGPFEVEERRRMIGILEDEGRRLVDRHRPRAGRLVGDLPRMQAERLEAGRFWRGHDRNSTADAAQCGHDAAILSVAHGAKQGGLSAQTRAATQRCVAFD